MPWSSTSSPSARPSTSPPIRRRARATTSPPAWDRQDLQGGSSRRASSRRRAAVTTMSWDISFETGTGRWSCPASGNLSHRRAHARDERRAGRQGEGAGRLDDVVRSREPRLQRLSPDRQPAGKRSTSISSPAARSSRAPPSSPRAAVTAGKTSFATASTRSTTWKTSTSTACARCADHSRRSSPARRSPTPQTPTRSPTSAPTAASFSRRAESARRRIRRSTATKKQLAQAVGDLAAQPAVKLMVAEEGWYRVRKSDLVAAGFDPGTDEKRLALFAEGIEQPILVEDGGDRVFGDDDTIEFYGIGVDTLATGARAYWLVRDKGAKARIAKDKPKKGKTAATSTPLTISRTERTIFFRPSWRTARGRTSSGRSSRTRGQRRRSRSSILSAAAERPRSSCATGRHRRIAHGDVLGERQYRRHGDVRRGRAIGLDAGGSERLARGRN